MEQLLQQYTEIARFPAHLHAKIMRRIYMRKHWYVFLAVVALFTAIGFALFNLWDTLIDSQAYLVIQDLFVNEFSFSSSFATELFGTLQDVGAMSGVLLLSISVFLLPSIVVPFFWFRPKINTY